MKKSLLLFFIGASIFYWFGCKSDSYRIGCEYYSEGKFDKSIEFLKNASKEGNKDSEYYLGCIYRLGGHGIEKNNEKSIFWHTKAAKKGHILSQFNLAHIELERNNLKEAINWFKKAADAGLVIAQYNLGCLYIQKDSVKNIQKGLELIEKSANSDLVNAQAYLGQLYETGDIVEKDENKAIYWYKKAADNNFASAQNILAYLWAEKEINLKDAEKYARKSVKKDSKNANYIDTLGWVLFKQGKYKEAISFLEKAVLLEPKSAIMKDHLGDAYEQTGNIEAVTLWLLALKSSDDKILNEKITAKLMNQVKTENDKKQLKKKIADFIGVSVHCNSSPPSEP